MKIQLPHSFDATYLCSDDKKNDEKLTTSLKEDASSVKDKSQKKPKSLMILSALWMLMMMPNIYI